MKHDSGKNHLPVFPLNTVVFVNGILQLQIFEQRYLTLVKTCMKNQHGFVTVLIRDGKEVNDVPEIYGIGTYVEIIDWQNLSHNLLGITIQGKQRVNIGQTKVNDDNLITADVDHIDNLQSQNSDIIDEELLSLLQALHKHPFVAAKYPSIDETSVTDIAYKLAELLPISNTEKQNLLESDQNRFLNDHLKSLITQLENLSPNNEFL